LEFIAKNPPLAGLRRCFTIEDFLVSKVVPIAWVNRQAQGDHHMGVAIDFVIIAVGMP
jgi:hypothetical protein